MAPEMKDFGKVFVFGPRDLVRDISTKENHMNIKTGETPDGRPLLAMISHGPDKPNEWLNIDDLPTKANEDFAKFNIRGYIRLIPDVPKPGVEVKPGKKGYFVQPETALFIRLLQTFYRELRSSATSFDTKDFAHLVWKFFFSSQGPPSLPGGGNNSPPNSDDSDDSNGGGPFTAFVILVLIPLLTVGVRRLIDIYLWKHEDARELDGWLGIELIVQAIGTGLSWWAAVALGWSGWNIGVTVVVFSLATALLPSRFIKKSIVACTNAVMSVCESVGSWFSSWF